MLVHLNVKILSLRSYSLKHSLTNHSKQMPDNTMWNMMCDVMPTISEDSLPQRHYTGEEANFERIMITILDERDRQNDQIRLLQEKLQELSSKLNDAEKEKESLTKQLNANLPQVFLSLLFLFIFSSNLSF